MRLVATLILAFAAASAHAGTTFIDLDTNPGSYSTWRTATGDASSMSFKATFVGLYKHKTWSPTYTVTFREGADHSLALKGTIFSKGVPTLVDATLKSGASTSSGPSNLKLELGRQAQVQISWRPGVISVSVDGTTQEYAVDFAPTQVAITCSTGELVVEDIEFGGNGA